MDNIINNVQGWGRFLVEAVREYAYKNNLKFETFSGDWVIRLETNPATSRKHIVKYLFGNEFGLNNTASRAICNDKSATYQVLTREKLKALEHVILLRPGSLGAPNNTYEIAKYALHKFGYSAIIKPNSGSGGDDINHIKSEKELRKNLDYMFLRYRALTISPFVNISAEYRVCVLNQNAELIYEKVKTQDMLQHNLSKGAVAKEIKDAKLNETLGKLAIRASKAVGINFANVDIINVSGNLMVIEINSGVMFEHYSSQSEENAKKAMRVYHKALDMLFEK